MAERVALEVEVRQEHLGLRGDVDDEQLGAALRAQVARAPEGVERVRRAGVRAPAGLVELQVREVGRCEPHRIRRVGALAEVEADAREETESEEDVAAEGGPEEDSDE